jgi:ABC-type Fe2+-enterobactin transport system substrate-binding protein
MDPLLIGAFAAAGALCIAAFGYRRGHRAGLARAARTTEQYRIMVENLIRQEQATVDAAGELSHKAARDAAVWQRRSAAMGRMLRSLGYSVQEIEDPATGKIDYRATMVQPASRLPLGPSTS